MSKIKSKDPSAHDLAFNLKLNLALPTPLVIPGEGESQSVTKSLQNSAD